MHYSFDRLIDLVKRTGDNLIVHDPIEGRDVVIMDVDKYEELLESQECTCEHDDFNSELEDVFDEDNDWHRAGDVLEDRYNFSDFDEEDEEEFDPDDYLKDLEGEKVTSTDFKGAEQEISFDFEEKKNSHLEEEIKIEDVPFDPPMPGSELERIPYSSKMIENKAWEEESLLEEEPVFLEEPV